MILETLLIIAFGGALITYLLGKISKKTRNISAVVVLLALVVIITFLYNISSKEIFYIGFLKNLSLVLRINTFSWLFAITISVVSALSIIFSLSYIKGKERTNFYYLMMMLVDASMIGIVLAGDFVTFYIFWEIMSWSAFLLISYNRGAALAAGMKYIIMSVIGSMAMLIGILSLYANYGTLNISELSAFMTSASSVYILFILITFGIGFGVKSAIIPLHAWLPDAHSQAPSPFSAVLSGILIKMGIYGFILIFYVIVGLKNFLVLGSNWSSFHYILCWVGVITIVIPSFIAILQDDAKRLLAWSSIGQIGYIILGISFGTSLGFAGGTFHIINHAIFKALLFLAVGAVEYRTGTRDLNSLGGLIKKMPITFLVVLIGAFGLIGVPLTNGFVSKWMIYKTLILEGHPFLAFFALLGTWAAILYTYKFIHNIFLGQLQEKHENIKRAPFSMQLPMIILAFAIILFGILPGIPLKIINTIGTSFGFESLNVNIWGIASDTGTLNTVNIFMAILVIGVILWLIFKAARKSVKINQYDNYAAGFSIPKEKYNYTVNFYNPLYRIITPYLKDFIDDFYMWISREIKKMSVSVRRIYSGDIGYYIMYIMLFLALLIFVQIKWNLW
jgi:NADH-quinone oxidoreductase subunit M